MDAVLKVENLGISFTTPDGLVTAATEVSFSIRSGDCLGIVGESGSGKSQIFMAAMGLLATNGRASGSVRYKGQELLGLDPRALNAVRGDRMTMIFQDPMTALTPHLTIGTQLAEVLLFHKGLGKQAATAAAIAMLDSVRIPDAARRMTQYPHELSGGMRQRVMIAMALMSSPDLVIADEPTTALDVTVQAQILVLLKRLKDQSGRALALITHDLGLVAGLADRVMVLYAGRVVESAPVRDIFHRPRHPYTLALLQSRPGLTAQQGGRLAAIPGQPPNLLSLPPGCAFADRCPHVHERCLTTRPELLVTGPDSAAACHLVEEVAG
ncbi:ABC transporter ATP-binding protein [Govanella unica]|uniref:ABC transporter ATP-binding protein n=1 Tax=Govanella unica TaxID=2975056 RepID=A0A9X3U0B7_9PROT|nr:ABC transporter ATP-binding protein [Govania unica]